MSDPVTRIAASDTSIASYGVADGDCLGRTHEEHCPLDLPPFELDLRRIRGCAAFRRLQYKTQVFISPQDDHFRTRLTHTLEVAGLARILAQLLRINSTLAEAIAAAHDIGHPPFGHAGEGVLNELMRDDGGFEHNAQSLRVVEYLEHPFPAFRGLNLTYEVREALAKHRTAFDHPARIETDDASLKELLDASAHGTIEGQVAALADRIAYDCHDLEDALGAAILDGDRLANVELWNDASKQVAKNFPNLSLFAMSRSILDRIQNTLLKDAVATTLHRIEQHGIQSIAQVRALDEPVLTFSAKAEAQVRELEDFLRDNVYGHPKLRRMDEMAVRLIAELFNSYREKPALMPQRFFDRIQEQGEHRVICDYVAGMTDRFCESEYTRIFMPFAGPLTRGGDAVRP